MLGKYMTSDSQRVYGIKYYGQHKPNSSYSLEDGLYIVPGAWEMVDDNGGQIRQNISYFVATELESEDSFRKKYRDWIIFDSFILYDGFPAYFYDENKIGNTIEVFEPSFIDSSDHSKEYPMGSEDYNDIDRIVLVTQDKQMELSYLDLYKDYAALSKKDKELIEWFVASPSRNYTRLNSIYKNSYWQLFHLVVILDTLIGIPPRCAYKYENCPECGFEPYPHYSVSRKIWLDDYLNNLINVKNVKDQYNEIISQAFKLRNSIAHYPLIDRSELPEIQIGFTDLYCHDRAIEEYKQNSIALRSLLLSLNQICRYLLLNKLFKLNFFKKIQPLHVTCVGNTSTA